MLINDYKIEFSWEVGCCTQFQSATVGLPDDIGQALPLLASVIKDAKYESVIESLYFKQDKRYIYVYPRMCYIPYIQSNGEARALVKQVKM